jgi:uncharacterized protein YpmB
MTKNRTQILVIILFIIAAVLRLSFCWFNPAKNAYDNHSEPITMIMEKNRAEDTKMETQRILGISVLSGGSN